MTRVLLDTSVLIKWFHTEGESESEQSRLLRAAHVAGDVRAHVIDLAVYEMGNVLSRALGWASRDVADQLDDVIALVGAPLSMTPAWWRTAAALAEEHRLSFYDASWAAAAQELGIALVSADRRLIDAGLAESPTAIVERLALR